MSGPIEATSLALVAAALALAAAITVPLPRFKPVEFDTPKQLQELSPTQINQTAKSLERRVDALSKALKRLEAKADSMGSKDEPRAAER